MDKLVELAEFGNARYWEIMATGIGEDPLTVAKQVLSEAKLVATAFDEKVAGIKTNPDLSDQGRHHQIQIAAENHLENLENLLPEIAKVETARQKEITKAKAKSSSPEETLLARFEQSEIRRLIQETTGGDPIQTRILYFDALEDGDAATMDAIENAPRLFPGVPLPDEKAKWRPLKF